jgi:hypothetical protein
MTISVVMAGLDPAIYRRTGPAVMAGLERRKTVETLWQTAVSGSGAGTS